MIDLHDLLDEHVRAGVLPGAVGIVARGDRIEVATAGSAWLGGPAMARDSIFRIASLTKPITAAAVLVLVEDGRIDLADPVVVRTPSSPVDDVVPATRPITVFDLLSAQAGYGFAADFTLPAVQRLADVQKDGREPQSFPEADVWMAELSRVPLLYQPGESWLYDTCSALQGVLVSRVSGRSLPEFLAERVLEPLGMTDTAFAVPAAKRHRFTGYYRLGQDGLVLADAPDGQWSTPPAFPLASGGLTGTADDLLAFHRMLLAEGTTADDARLLSAASVRLMTTDHTTAAHREIGRLFLEGQGWGFGGSVDIAATDPWNVPGRYGWVGGTGTSAHVTPSTGTIAVLLTQVGMDSPAPAEWMRDFWRYAA